MSNDKSELFSSRLKSARISKGFTQKTLAEELGIGGTAIANYEAGKNGPKPHLLSRLSELLDTSPGYLMGENEAEQTRNEEMNLHPRIEAQAKEIMDREGFTSMDQLVTWFVKEDMRKSPPMPTPGSLESEIEELESGIREAFGDAGLNERDDPENN